MKKVYGCIFLTAFLFATMEVTLKVAGNNLDAFQLTFLRFLIGGLILLPFGIKEVKEKNIRITLKDIGMMTIAGILIIPVSMVLFQLGVMNCNASTAAVLFCTNPIFTIVFAHFVLSEKINRSKVLVILLGISGLVLMIRPWDMQEGNTITGMIYLLVSAAVFGLYTCLGKITTARVGAFAQTSISFVLGSLILFLIILVTGRPVLEGVAENWITVLYTGIFVTGIAYLSFFIAIRNSDAVTGSITFLLKPAMAPVIAVIVLHEVLLWNTILGIVFVLIASGYNIFTQRRDAARKVLE